MKCTSCENSTTEEENTIVLSRRIVVRPDCGSVQVKAATSVLQICPACSEEARSGTIEFRCIMPPLLHLEREITMNYLRRLVDGKELTERNVLPLACTICRKELPSEIPFVDVSIASEVYVLDSTHPGQRSNFEPPPSQVIQQASIVNVANICGQCSKETWNVEVHSGRFGSRN